MEQKFNQVDIMHFWIEIRNQYREIAKRAVNHLISFESIYIREKSSLYAATKTKYRNRLDAEDCRKTTTAKSLK